MNGCLDRTLQCQKWRQHSKDNIDNISRYKGTVFTSSIVDQLEAFCDPILPALQRLDNKDRTSNEPPDKDDILDVITAVHKEEATEVLFTDAFNACSPLLMMAIHIIAFNCLLHNPDALADQSVRNTATDSLRANPTKQNVNQYLIDAILQKRRSVQRTSEDVWDRSLYNAGTDTPRSDTQAVRRRRLDTADDGATPGTSGTSAPRRRLTNVPRSANSTSPIKRMARGRAATQKGRREPAVTTDVEDNDEQTQLYVAGPTSRQGRKDRKRTAASNLPTSFDDDDQAEHLRTKKNKRPVVGPPTAKNRRTADSDSTSSDTADEEQQALPKATSDKKRPTSAVAKKVAAVESSQSDLDDDELGITPRTPPKSPFYRGHRDPSGESRKGTTAVPTTSKGETAHGKKKTKERVHKTAATGSANEQERKPKKKKHTTPLEELVNEEDKLYKDLAKIAKKGK